MNKSRLLLGSFVTLLVAGLAGPSFGAAAPAADKANSNADAVVVASKDKPKKSKDKPNPNDGKDGDPDDGNAGKGNDKKTTPGDGAAKD